MKKSGSIDSVRVQSPCTEDWNEMTGNVQVRFCSHCSKNVNNLSTMTRKEARKLVLASGGKLCVRYVQDPRSGGPLFAPKFIRIAGRAGLAETSRQRRSPALCSTPRAPSYPSRSFRS
jgi:hypothetical protein